MRGSTHGIHFLTGTFQSGGELGAPHLRVTGHTTELHRLFKCPGHKLSFITSPKLLTDACISAVGLLHLSLPAPLLFFAITFRTNVWGRYPGNARSHLW